MSFTVIVEIAENEGFGNVWEETVIISKSGDPTVYLTTEVERRFRPETKSTFAPQIHDENGDSYRSL